MKNIKKFGLILFVVLNILGCSSKTDSAILNLDEEQNTSQTSLNLFDLSVIDNYDLFSALCSNTNNPHLSPKSSLSLAWSESKLSKSRIEAFALKTELLFDDYFYCFYISNDTKAFVDQYHYTNPYSLGVDIESMEINYPRYFKHLFDTGVLSSKDCMFVYKVDLSNDYVEYEFDDFVLIDVICLVKSLNTTYEKSFVVSVSYNIDNKKAIFTDEIEPFFQLYSNAKILLYNIPYINSIYKNNYLSISLLYSFSMTIDVVEEKEVVTSSLSYDSKLLQQSQSYYDEIDKIIFYKELIGTYTYDEEGNYYISYLVKCYLDDLMFILNNPEVL